ncbi:HAMP domain-containing sensor histidine kinase [Flavobacterium sp. JP2137]|uniref:HAMP domain-containing sensor histidine kinase n=1 Tax=Flavobacterium sp. JP2137 TaxID=3414510 RepID=UPI003D3016D5
MKIKTRLTILFTVLAVAILLVFATVLYWSSEKSREKEFYLLLQKEAITKANLFLDAQVSPATLHQIYSNNRQILHEVEVAVYDTSFHLLYHDAVEIDMVKETRTMVDEIYLKGSLKFYQDQWQVIGLKYHFKNQDYIITATAFDEYGFKKQENLLKTILFMTLVSTVLIFGAGYFYSNRALKPVQDIIDEVNKISVSNLDLRIKPARYKDELHRLGETFNAMLDRLEDSFDAQKQFVSNISHELRTPLAAIIAELELSQRQDLTADAYLKTINNALTDSERIVKLSNSLLDFAKAHYDRSEIAFKEIRVDEVLLDACQQLQQSQPNYKIHLNFLDELDLDQWVSTYGNPYLLQVAFVNLLENACKFSHDNQCSVLISCTPSDIVLAFSDNGIGIAEAELEHIFTPFYRGSKANAFAGNGIGLSLTQKIVSLHHGQISVVSQANEGTTFTIILPHL